MIITCASARLCFIHNRAVIEPRISQEWRVGLNKLDMYALFQIRKHRGAEKNRSKLVQANPNQLPGAFKFLPKIVYQRTPGIHLYGQAQFLQNT